jgi:hypothetical protein
VILYSWSPGTCGGQGNIYTYRTLDSRVKNIAPTWDQISDTEFYKFKNDSELEKFYLSVINDLSLIKTDIVSKTAAFSGASSTDITGVVSNLSQLKQLISSANNGMHQITTFNPLSLL